MSENSAQERLGTGEIGAAIPIDTKQVIDTLLRPAEDKRYVSGRQPEFEDEEELQLIEDVSTAIKRILFSKGHLAVSISSREAFVYDVKRKVLLIYQLVERVVDASFSELKQWLNTYVEAARTGNTELMGKAAEKIDRLYKKIYLAPVIALKLIDDYLGVLQINLPVDIMPNLIKAHMGFVTT